MARFVDRGSAVFSIIAVTPSLAKDGSPMFSHKRDRTFETIDAAKSLGVIHTVLLSVDEYSLAHDAKTVQAFDKYVFDFEPDLIITHGQADTQQDHVTVGKIAHTLARKNRIAIWEMSHSFPSGWRVDRPQPNLFVDITKYHDRKMMAVAAYESQIKRYGPNWMEGIEARDRYYGALLNQEGEAETRYAEAFVVAKMVWT